MFFKKIQEPGGEYGDDLGRRYQVAATRRIRTAQGINVGYEEFPTLDDALRQWGVFRIPETADETLAPPAP